MTSIHDKTRICFVSSDGNGGWVVKMVMPDNRPLEYPLDLKRAVRLSRELSNAVDDLVASLPPAPPPAAD